MYLRINHGKLLEKYKNIQSKIDDFKNIELNALQNDNDRYIKAKIRTYEGKIYTDFHGLNVPEYGVECKSF